MFGTELSTKFLIPIVIILAISVVVPTLLKILKLKFLPTFAIELLIGVLIAKPFNNLIDSFSMENLIDGIYALSLSMIMFLSGYDVDFSLLKEKKEDNNFSYLKSSILILGLVYLVSFGLACFFATEISITELSKVLLITLALSGVFAGLVVPLLHSEKVAETEIGKFMQTFANLAELVSIVLLSIFMIIVDISKGAWYYGLIMIVIIVIVYIFNKKVKINMNKDLSSGIIHLPMRLLLLSLFAMVFLSELSGGEYILGAFLFGMLVKTMNVKKQNIHTFEDLVFGVFAPMLYIIIGTTIDFESFINHPQYLLTVGLLFIAILVARLPLLILLKHFRFGDVGPSIIISTCTIIVSIAVEHIGGPHGINVLSYEFCESLILASVLTCIIPPSVFKLFLDFGVKNKKTLNEETEHE